MSCGVQGRAAFTVSFVDVRTTLFDEAYHDREVPLMGCDVKWHVTYVVCLVDACSKLLHQALYDRHVAFLGGHAQGQITILCRLFGVSYGFVASAPSSLIKIRSMSRLPTWAIAHSGKAETTRTPSRAQRRNWAMSPAAQHCTMAPSEMVFTVARAVVRDVMPGLELAEELVLLLEEVVMVAVVVVLLVMSPAVTFQHVIEVVIGGLST
jgi:hypothetical protein